MSYVATLDAWGSVWAGMMIRSLVEATGLLLAFLVVWLPLRRRISCQLAYGLFLLVLVKAAVPFPIALPAAAYPFAPWFAPEGLREVARPVPRAFEIRAHSPVDRTIPVAHELAPIDLGEQ